MITYFYKFQLNFKIILSGILLIVLCTDIHAQIQFEPQPAFFKYQREMPLISLATVQDINVSSFGGKIDDGKDDMDSILKAIAKAKSISSASKPVRIVFENGKYDIIPSKDSFHALLVAGLRNVVFDGNGAELINHNPSCGFFELRACTNVIFKNFIFDYLTLPFTQGLVTAVDAVNNSFTLQITDGFPLLTEKHFETAGQKWGCLKDVNGKLKAGANNLFPYKGWEQISGNTFKVNTANKIYTSQVEVGDYFVQIARINGTAVFITTASKNVTFLDVTIYSSPAGSFGGRENYEVNILNCKVIPKPGSGSVHSGNADIIHISGSYLGPWVQGCRFEGYTDDGVNLKHTGKIILEIVSPTVLRVKHKITISDKVIIYNPRDGIVTGIPPNIINVTDLPDNVYEVTFDGNHNAALAGVHQTADKMYLTNHATESFIFRDNIFKNGRRYGILLQSSFGQIKNCTFENLSSSGVKMENGVDWSEGFVANNIAITDNTFINCGFDSNYIADPESAAISARVSKLKTPNNAVKWNGTQIAEWQGIENIIITNNKIEYNISAINLRNVNGGLLLDNAYIRNTKDPTLKTIVTPQDVKTFNCSNMHFEALRK